MVSRTFPSFSKSMGKRTSVPERPADYTICWDTLNTKDMDASLSFYTELMGWTTDDMGPSKILKLGDGMVGDVSPAPEGVPSHWLTHFAVPDLKASTEKVEKMPMAIEADQAADRIFAAIAARTQVAYVPFQWMPIMTVIKSIPSVIFRRLSI